MLKSSGWFSWGGPIFFATESYLHMPVDGMNGSRGGARGEKGRQSRYPKQGCRFIGFLLFVTIKLDDILALTSVILIPRSGKCRSLVISFIRFSLHWIWNCFLWEWWILINTICSRSRDSQETTSLPLPPPSSTECTSTRRVLKMLSFCWDP